MARNLLLSEVGKRWDIEPLDALKLLRNNHQLPLTYAYPLDDGFPYDVPEKQVRNIEIYYPLQLKRAKREADRMRIAATQLKLF